MMILIELFILLSTILPMYHMINALTAKKTRHMLSSEKKWFSILVPCFNEEDTVKFSIIGLLEMDYSNFEAVYINDGSEDGTLKALDRELELSMIAQYSEYSTTVYRSVKHPNFYVIDKPNGGKSSALNAGIRFASADLIVTLDADSVLKSDALLYMNRVFEDEAVAAAGGSIHILQGYDTVNLEKRRDRKRKLIVTLQILEYLKGFYIYKLSLARQRALAIISGAFGVFRKDILVSAGGYRQTLGEDIDITMRIQQLIHKTGMKIEYLPEAVCYTQCPENLSDLKKQRIRWQKGFIECVVFHWRFLLKTFLFKSLSFHFLIEALAVGMCSCLFTIFTYSFAVVIAFLDFGSFIVFLYYFAFCAVFNIVYTLIALAISRKYNRYPGGIIKRAWIAILLDLFFYRYFNLMIYLGGTAVYLWNKKSKECWNKIERVRREFVSPNA